MTGGFKGGLDETCTSSTAQQMTFGSKFRRYKTISVNAVPWRNLNTELVRINKKLNITNPNDKFDKEDFSEKNLAKYPNLHKKVASHLSRFD